MPINQRRELHGAIARALEQDVPGQDCALLAHHFYHACDYDRAVANADAAADRALQIGAYREAAYFLDLCERVSARDGIDDPDKVTRRRRQLADAYHGLGDLVARRRHARRALAAAGQDADPSKATQTIDVTARLSRRLLPGIGRSPAGARLRLRFAAWTSPGHIFT